MRIVAKRTLREFWKGKADAEKDLKAWHSEAKAASWITPRDIKAVHNSASILKNQRAVFNICGNRYRRVVKINYEFQIVYVRFIGTHKEYDRINAEEI